ncbi:MAG TPA: hypothetical protein VL752_18430 [Acidisoma sp.]|uniref:hypothetical protein n=1 Tax=Acidisoma sp. TaxID=1872115 RepID=UPI002C9532BC|nr:hypothetical protein [Acidisoma sp.]HTI02928.1 hypothetical protein [Acidisoma sp.]
MLRQLRLNEPITTLAVRFWPYALRAVALLVLFRCVWAVLAAAARGELAAEVAAHGPEALTVAAVYLAGHVMRVVRLALLIGNARLSLRRLTAFHFYTAGVAFGMPLRLGDAYRGIELGLFTGGTVFGITIVWIERLFDLAVLLPLLLVTLGYASLADHGYALSAYAGITLLTLLFVSLSALMVAIVPDNLRRFGTYLIRQHEGAWTIKALKGIEDLRRTINRIPVLIKGKIPSLVALTVLIWMFEFGSFEVLVSGVAGSGGGLSGLLAFLSRTTTNGNLPDALAKLGSLDAFARMYVVAGQAPLAIIAAAAFFVYASGNGRRNGS